MSDATRTFRTRAGSYLRKRIPGLIPRVGFWAQVPFGVARRLFTSMAESGLAYLEKCA